MIEKADLLVVIGTIIFLISMGHVENTRGFWLVTAAVGGAILFLGIMLAGGNS